MFYNFSCIFYLNTMKKFVWTNSRIKKNTAFLLASTEANVYPTSEHCKKFIYFFDKWNTIRFFTSELTIKEGRSKFPNVQGRNDIKKCWNCLYEEQNFSSFLVFYNFLHLMALRMAAFKTGISWRVIFFVLTNYDIDLGGN